MIRKRDLKAVDVVNSVLFLFIIFCPAIRFLPKYSWILAFCGVVTLLNNGFRKYIGFNTKSNILLWIMIVVNVVFLGLAVPTLHQTNDYTYIPLLIGLVLSMFRCLLLAFIVYKTGTDTPMDYFIELFLNACCVYVGFTILFIVFPQFKTFWLYTVLENVTTHEYYAYQFRYSFDGFAAFSSSSTFAFASLLSGYVIAKKKVYCFADLLRMIVCAVGGFFYGRIALVGILLGVFVILSHNNSKKKIRKIIWRAVLIVILLVVLVNYLATIDESFEYWRDWAFAIVKQIFVDGEITDHSVTHMFEDMYYLPDQIETIVFGDGFYTNKNGNGYYGSTDVGFMRIMLYAGLIGIVMSYSTLIYSVNKSLQKADCKLTKKFLWCFLVLWVVLECKGEAYHRMLIMLCPLLLMLECEKRMVSLQRGGQKDEC